MAGELLIVDAPYVLYRSFFALPESIRGRDGQSVNALLGAVNSLVAVIDAVAPRAVVICFGAESATYRVALYSNYHAARDSMPAPLAAQFALAPKLFEAFGWRIAHGDELEADDLLGGYAAVERDGGGHALLLTGDRDLYQCASAAVEIAFLKGGEAGFERVDAAGVVERYGVAPGQVPDFIALRGDPSDGLPGAPGIGAKTAAALLNEFGTLESLLEAVGTEAAPVEPACMRPRIAAALRGNAGLLRAFREIATLRPIAVSRPQSRATDFAGGAKLADALGMGALAGRLESHR